MNLFLGNIQQDEHCIIYLCNEFWFQILFYLCVTDIIRLSFVSRRLNEIVYGHKLFKKCRKLSNSIIDKKELYDSFMKRFDEVIKKLSFYFDSIVCLYLIYRLQSLKNEFYINNVLCHLLFGSRSPSSESGVDNVHVCLLGAQMILFCRLNSTFL